MKLSKKILERLVDYLKTTGAERILLFGSQARGEAKPKSDVDIVVRFKKPKSLLQLVHIELEASEKIGKKVDLLTEKSVHPYVAERVYREAKVLYG